MNWATAFIPGDNHPDHHNPRRAAWLGSVDDYSAAGANPAWALSNPDNLIIHGKLGVYLFFVLVLTC